MSTENKSKTRPYRQRERARQREQTRQRIVAAVVELHRTVGPANTTISEVAERAGVGRMTVYKHFPTESDLFAACGAHWSEQNPRPDFADCLSHESLQRRCRCVLERLYAYYRANHDMLGNVLRDARSLPELARVLDASWTPALEELEQALLPPGLDSGRRRRLRAALRLTLDLGGWEALTRDLSDRQAARVAAAMIQACLDDP